MALSPAEIEAGKKRLRLGIAKQVADQNGERGIVGMDGRPVTSDQPTSDQPVTEAPPAPASAVEKPKNGETVSINGITVLAECSDGSWHKIGMAPGVAQVIADILQGQKGGLRVGRDPVVMKREGWLRRWLRDHGRRN
jgi:hypothetical protein